MSIYWEIKRESPTGVKISNLIKEMDVISTEIKKLCDDIGTKQYQRGHNTAGIVAVRFEEEPDMNLYKYYLKEKKLYSPRLSTKIGKALQKRFDDCGFIARGSLDKLVGNAEFIYSVGFSEFDSCFVITTREKWHSNKNFNLTDDCKEIKWSEFTKLEEEDNKN